MQTFQNVFLNGINRSLFYRSFYYLHSLFGVTLKLTQPWVQLFSQCQLDFKESVFADNCSDNLVVSLTSLPDLLNLSLLAKPLLKVEFLPKIVRLRMLKY